jgi:hypothetical protein
MMYDSSGCMFKFRSYTSVHLAWWHNYKWCTKKIMEVFADDFMAGLFHTLFPAHKFIVKYMSHTTISTYLSYVRLAFPSFRDQLNTAMNDVSITGQYKVVLTNLFYLCEYFIPVVHIYCCLM